MKENDNDNSTKKEEIKLRDNAKNENKGWSQKEIQTYRFW